MRSTSTGCSRSRVRSGCFSTPAFLLCEKASVSGMERRIHRPARPPSAPSRNGMRQPQAAISGLVRVDVSAQPTADAARMPTAALKKTKLE